MSAHRLSLALAIALLVVTSAGLPAPGAQAIPRPDGCKHVVSTGTAFTARDCRNARRVARVDNTARPHDPRRATTYPRRERPLERLLTRGDGRIHARGDKAGLRELREKQNRGGKGRGGGRAGIASRFR
jgi:hypothetical protein